MPTPPAPSSPAPETPAIPGACPCGSGRTLAECCGPVIDGTRLAATAEELMRARFTAHATRNHGFVHRTYRGTAGQPQPPDEAYPVTEWTRLVVHSHTPGNTPDIAHVDFSAYGVEQGAGIVLHEKAEFVRENGAWIYTRALREGPAPVRGTGPKAGRNDPCPCGSGKKFKHCCLGK